MFEAHVRLRLLQFTLRNVAPHFFGKLAKLLDLPPLRNFPERRGDAGVVFVAGEAELDEPLAVKSAGHSFQDLDAPLAVLDQVVVGGQDAGDAALDGERGD